MRLIIFRNCLFEKDLDLVPGNYRIGRKEGCDILLEGKNISRNHAMLIIGKDFAEIEDLGSSNGIIVDGKKIKGKRIGINHDVKIGEYKIKLEAVSANRKKNTTINAFSAILLFAGNHPYRSSMAITGFFFLLLTGALTAVFENHSKSTHIKQEIERAILIAKGLKEINSTAWLSNETSKFSLTDFGKTDGIVSLILVDQYGRVQAPIDQLNKNLNHPIFQRTLKTGKVSTEKQTEGEYLVCYPALYSGIVKGAVILQIKIRKLEFINDNSWVLVWGIFGLLAGAVIGVAILLVEVFLKPWRDLLEAANNVADQVGNKLHIIPGYKEIENTKILFERLLVSRSFNGTHFGNDYVKDSSLIMEENGYELESTCSGSYFVDYEIFFIIEEHSHKIICCNPGFKKLFGIGSEQEDSIIELFDDPDILKAVSSVLNENQEVVKVLIGDAPYLINKIICKDNPGHALIFFEKTNA